MLTENQTPRTGLAMCLVALGLFLICIGLFRAFEGTGQGLEILSATALFALAAYCATCVHRFFSAPMICTVSLFSLGLPLLN